MLRTFRQILTVEDLRRQRCQRDNHLTSAYYEGKLKYQKDVEALHMQCLSNKNTLCSPNPPQVPVNKILKDPSQLTQSHCDFGSKYCRKVHEVLGKGTDSIHNSLGFNISLKAELLYDVTVELFIISEDERR